MVKTKRRINISVSEDINKELVNLARRDQISIAGKALELIKKAIQMEEDVVLDWLAQQRDNKNPKYLSHERAWK